MRVNRKVNVNLQTFQAWQHRQVIDDVVDAYPMDPLGIDYQSTPTDFTPHTIAVPSGLFASGVTATSVPKGLL
jgi:hypothetical protein